MLRLMMMKRGVFWGLVSIGLLASARADGPVFSQAVSAGDFNAAGLAKLTPAELARLDQLISAYKSGLLEQAQQQAAAAEAAKASAETRARQAEADAKEAKAAKATAEAEAKQNKPSFLGRAEALISPGTKIEYKPVESRLVGDITGWDSRTIFLLENGQRWQVADYSHYFNGSPVRNPAVTVRPVRVFGGFEMDIEGLGVMRVRLVNGPTYHEN
jgi:hypothetical protein